MLTATQWEIYTMLFAEYGMAVCETVGRVWVEDESCERGGSRVSSFVLRIRERM